MEDVDQFVEKDVEEGVDGDGGRVRRGLIVDDDVTALVHLDVAAVQQEIPHRHLHQPIQFVNIR